MSAQKLSKLFAKFTCFLSVVLRDPSVSVPQTIPIAVCHSLQARFSDLAYIFQPMNSLVQFLSHYKTNNITVIIVIIITSAVIHKEYYEILQAGSPPKLF